jgi:hypothetical protein
MALLSSADAIAALTAAGWSAYKSPARANGRCQTLCYVVGGQPVNLGRLRQLAREVMGSTAATAEPPAAEPVMPETLPKGAQRVADRAGVATVHVENGGSDYGRQYVAYTAPGYWFPAVECGTVIASTVGELADYARPELIPVDMPTPSGCTPAALPAAEPAAAKPAALSALESLAAGGPLDCATWQALGWSFEGFLAWAQRSNADAMVERLRATIRDRGAAACLELL